MTEVWSSGWGLGLRWGCLSPCRHLPSPACSPGLIFDTVHSLHPPALGIAEAAAGETLFGDHRNWSLI